MPSTLLLLESLHLGMAALLLGGVTASLARPDATRLRRLIDIAAALLAATAMPFTGDAGWWIDMPGRKMVPAIAVLALGLAVLGSRSLPGRLATLALAGFFGFLGLASLRNGTPLAGFMAAKSILFGLTLALLPWEGAVRTRMVLLVLLLLAGAMLGVHKDIPVF
jgi:hypothetical protein